MRSRKDLIFFRSFFNSFFIHLLPFFSRWSTIFIRLLFSDIISRYSRKSWLFIYEHIISNNDLKTSFTWHRTLFPTGPQIWIALTNGFRSSKRMEPVIISQRIAPTLHISAKWRNQMEGIHRMNITSLIISTVTLRNCFDRLIE